MTEFIPIHTKHRTIVSPIPHPDTVPIIEELHRLEPHSMSGMPPVLWHQAQGINVMDGCGNKWIDFGSGVVLANAGHSHSKISAAIKAQLDAMLWQNYCNPSGVRLRTVKTIDEITPPYLDKVYLLTTGAEATECVIKLIRLHGRSISPEKVHVISYFGSFHGRTMASQRAGGFMDQQEWMGIKPGGFHHIPFPECFRCPWGKTKHDACGAECLERSLDTLREQGLKDELVAGVLTETFQGPTVAFMPDDYVRALREWTTANRALIACDEIQAGFGRTGKWFGFEHHGVEIDLVAMGKGMTSSLPMSAVAGRAHILDLALHGEMSSTHTGNPLCCAAALGNIQAIREERMVENAAAMGKVIERAIHELRERLPGRIGHANGKGVVWAFFILDPQTGNLDADLATRTITRCMEKGLLMLGTGHRGTLKIAPPLCIIEEALLEGIGVIEEALNECLSNRAS